MERDTNIILVCPFCGGEHSVQVDCEDYLSYQCGELAQSAFPYLTATEREQIISGMCPHCQAEIFGDEDEEDEGDDICECMRESLESTGQWW